MLKARIIIMASGAAILLIVIVILRTYVFDFLIIRGNSMSPTLMQGDIILLNRQAYRSRVPDRRDVITFRMGYKSIVKRVVGLPGDTIKLEDGLVYCDGKPIVTEQHTIFRHHLPIQQPYGPYVIRQRHVFVIGDNTVVSMDSRDYGAIPYQDIIGKATFICYPLKRIGRIDKDRKENELK